MFGIFFCGSKQQLFCALKVLFLNKRWLFQKRSFKAALKQLQMPS
jgi:hypothetical protein